MDTSPETVLHLVIEALIEYDLEESNTVGELLAVLRRDA